jgi:hypothetical protein
MKYIVRERGSREEKKKRKRKEK